MRGSPACILVAALVLAAEPASASDAGDTYARFLAAQQAGEFDTTIALGEQYLAATSKRPKQRPDPMLPSRGATCREIAGLLERIADFAGAARRYEACAASHSEEPQSLLAQQKAAVWYGRIGESQRAVAAYDKYVVWLGKLRAPERERIERALAVPLPFASESVFAIGLLHEARGDAALAAEAFARFEKSFPNEAPAKLQEARYRRMLALRKLERNDEAAELCHLILRKSQMMPERERTLPTSRTAAAHCRFLSLEPEFERFLRMGFGLRTLKGDLALKIKEMGRLKAEYARVVDDGDPDWAMAALVRTAMLPKNLAKSLLEAPMPKGYDPEQGCGWRGCCYAEEEGLKYEDPAIAAFEAVVAKSLDLGVYNEWTLEAQRLLLEYNPNAFGELREPPLLLSHDS